MLFVRYISQYMHNQQLQQHPEYIIIEAYYCLCTHSLKIDIPTLYAQQIF